MAHGTLTAQAADKTVDDPSIDMSKFYTTAFLPNA